MMKIDEEILENALVDFLNKNKKTPTVVLIEDGLFKEFNDSFISKEQFPFQKPPELNKPFELSAFKSSVGTVKVAHSSNLPKDFWGIL